jgi:hypothetical protein
MKGRAILFTAWIFLAGVGGCASIDLSELLSDPNEPADATLVTGTWVGTYTCAQGLTGLSLHVNGLPTGEVVATFDFQALESNPTVPSGKYEITGTYVRPGALNLKGIRWAQNPGSWNMVSLEGRVYGNATRFSGTVPECRTEFSVQRS